MLDVRDRLIGGKYRSDRFPAVPFKTLEDMMQVAQDALTPAKPEQGEYPSCGATLTVGDTVHECALRLGHTFWSTQQHDWAKWL